MDSYHLNTEVNYCCTCIEEFPPYPTVVIVTSAHQNDAGIEMKSVSGSSFSAKKMAEAKRTVATEVIKKNNTSSLFVLTIHRTISCNRLECLNIFDTRLNRRIRRIVSCEPPSPANPSEM
eukprot:m.96512 g.96512  ORF g.96512 m.96512 type:complete len:120 (-) comp13549_c0_seq3:970-1329(-)